MQGYMAKRKKKITDLLVFGPTAPPTDHGQGPALADWCEHESILRSASSKAMSRKGTSNASTSSGFVDPLLNGVVGELLARLYDTICTHQWKDAVIWLQFPCVVVDLQPPHPDGEPTEGVRGRQVRLWIKLIVVSYDDQSGANPSEPMTLLMLPSILNGPFRSVSPVSILRCHPFRFARRSSKCTARSL
jgi:hypothetical protein